MLRMKTTGILIVLIAIAKINWVVALGIVVCLAGLDYLLQKEEEENFQDVKNYIDAMQNVRQQQNRDDYFENFMKEGDSNERKTNQSNYC